jgi:predicted outer membrane repeat protein
MRSLSWLRTPKTTRSARQPRIRLLVEELEDRSIPAILNVTTTLDVIDPNDGLLSLREAIIQANASKGADTINLPAGTYSFSLAGAGEDNAATGDLDIRDDLTIVGAGSDATTITAAQSDRVFQIWGASVDVSRVTVSGGRSAQGAGFDSQHGALKITQCQIAGNATLSDSADGMGGAVSLVGGSLEVVHSDIWSNTAYALGGSARGGAIYNWGGAVTISNSSLYANEAIGYFGGSALGGGVYNTGGSLEVTNSSLLGNRATSDIGGAGGVSMGGGIYFADGMLDITNSDVFACSVRDASLSGDAQGGGIFLAGGTATVTNSLFDSNTAMSGPGMSKGGAVYVAGGSLGILNCTFESNRSENGSGGALYLASGSVRISKNTLFRGNLAVSDPDIFGPYTTY